MTNSHSAGDPTGRECRRRAASWEIAGDRARGLPPRFFCRETEPCPRHTDPATMTNPTDTTTKEIG